MKGVEKMDWITNAKELETLAEQGQLNAINKRFGDKFMGGQIIKPIFFFDNGVRFMTEAGGIRKTPASKQTKNFNFFV